MDLSPRPAGFTLMNLWLSYNNIDSTEVLGKCLSILFKYGENNYLHNEIQNNILKVKIRSNDLYHIYTFFNTVLLAAFDAQLVSDLRQ